MGQAFGSIAQAYAGKKARQETGAAQENIFDELMGILRPEVEHRRKVYWPVEEAVGGEVTRRMGEDPSQFFESETPYYERAKERIGREALVGRRRLGQQFAQAGQTERLPQVYKELAKTRGRELTGFTKALAMRKAERIPEEKSRRISQAMSFAAGRGAAPSLPFGTSAGGGGAGIDFGSIMQGAGQDAQFWTDFGLRMQELRGRQGGGRRLTSTSRATIPARSVSSPAVGRTYG